MCENENLKNSKNKQKKKNKPTRPIIRDISKTIKRIFESNGDS